MRLYDYYRSSAAYRVRFALNLKGVEYEKLAVNLLDGEQRSTDYELLNPQHLVPTVETEHGTLAQSLAIIEYLEHQYPSPPLLSDDAWLRAKQRSMAQVIACDVHPINNLRVLNYLRDQLSVTEDAVQQWISHWIGEGFAALERITTDEPYLGGEQPMLPDILLVPQMYNARRFNVSLTDFPKLVAIVDRCNGLKPFADAAPNAAE